jgi:hypothetical protein
MPPFALHYELWQHHFQGLTHHSLKIIAHQLELYLKVSEGIVPTTINIILGYDAVFVGNWP